jgi:hypothetical protein
MNQIKKLTAIAALFAVATLRSNADTTNLVQDITIQLSGFRQGATQTNGNNVSVGVDSTHIGTDGVIAALGASTGNSFSKSARLVSATSLSDGSSSVQIRDGGNSVDVTGFFAHEQFGDTLQTGSANLRNGRSSESDFSVQRFALHDVGGYPPLTLHFDVQGITEVDDSANGGVSSPGSNLSSNVVGTGDRSGRFMILEGSVNVHGHSTEVVPDGGDGGGGPNV